MEASRQDSKGLAQAGAAAKRNVGIAAGHLATAGRRAGRGFGPWLRGRRGTEIATIAALIGGMLMALSEFFDLYRVTSPTGATLQTVTGGSDHGYALLLIGIVVVAGVALARFTEQWPPAMAAAGLCVIALGIVLFGSLPDATSSGLTGTRKVGEASPAFGFWIELVATALALVGSAAVGYSLRSGDEPDRTA